MQPRFIKIGKSKLEYYVFNEEAKEPVLCFHGFDQRGNIFQELAQQNPENKIIGISLFGHGGSILATQDHPLQPFGFKHFISEIIEQEKIHRFDLCGYSLGGRYALFTYELFNAQIDHIYLLAPDGLIRNFWFLLATSNQLSRKIFYWIMQSVKHFSGVVKMLQKLKIIKPALSRFVQKQLKKPAVGMKIYYAWVSSYTLKLSPKKLANLNADGHTHIQFFLAKNDPLIDQNKIQNVANQIPNAAFIITNKTHLQLGHFNFLNPTL